MATSPRPARICFVLSRFHPIASGAERQAMAQGLELVRRGHEVRVITRAIPGEPFDEVLGGIQVHRWVRTWNLGPAFGVSFLAGTIRALRRLRAEYDLIHAHQGLWEAVAVGLGRRVPSLIQPASSGPFGEAEILARTRGSGLLRRAILGNTAFAAISADIEREWLDLGVPAARMVRTASGVDADHFRPGSVAPAIEASLPARPRVVFTGRLHPQKSLDRLVDAWPEVAWRTGASLVLVGDGPERDRLAGRARSLGVGDRVRFVGSVADPADHLRAADAFALPSLAEGMSNSLLEAMATGLPCLASAIGGNTDLLGDGRSGILLGPDPAAWSAALIRVLTEPDLARALGESARAKVEAGFALPVVVDRYQTIYRRLLAGDPPGGREPPG